MTPLFVMHFFQAHILVILYFFHGLRNKLKATILDWCLDNNNVIEKYLVEMIRMTHDETPFLSVV
jgi:hypothetical protein